MILYSFTCAAVRMAKGLHLFQEPIHPIIAKRRFHNIEYSFEVKLGIPMNPLDWIQHLKVFPRDLAASLGSISVRLGISANEVWSVVRTHHPLYSWFTHCESLNPV